MPIGFFRSFCFNILFYMMLVAFMIFGGFFLITPRRWAVYALRVWARCSLTLLKKVAGINIEVRGQENIPKGACVFVGKHQSFWEIFALLPFIQDPAIVLKRELSWIPLFGWFILKFQMIAVNRRGRTRALLALIHQVEAAVNAGRQLIIFPEGTRRDIDAPPDYKPGISAIYAKIPTVPFVPFALNSGIFWPRRKPLTYQGCIVVEFLPPLPSGLSRRDFEAKLISEIEGTTRRLVEEARQSLGKT